MQAPRTASLALGVFALLGAVACKQDSDSTTPPAAVQVSGMWRGTFGPQNTPLGTLVFVFLPGEESGRVEGSVSFGGNECLTTHTFEGVISGLAMEGTGADAGVELRFEFDLRQAENPDTPRIQGRFLVELAEGCEGLEQPFRATPDVLPLVAGESSELEPGSGWSALWQGGWLPDASPRGSRAIEPVLLFLEERAGDAIEGALILDGQLLAFAGRAGESLLLGIARNEARTVELVLRPRTGAASSSAHLLGQLARSERDGSQVDLTGELSLHRRPPPASPAASP